MEQFQENVIDRAEQIKAIESLVSGAAQDLGYLNNLFRQRDSAGWDFLFEPGDQSLERFASALDQMSDDRVYEKMDFSEIELAARSFADSLRSVGSVRNPGLSDDIDNLERVFVASNQAADSLNSISQAMLSSKIGEFESLGARLKDVVDGLDELRNFAQRKKSAIESI